MWKFLLGSMLALMIGASTQLVFAAPEKVVHVKIFVYNEVTGAPYAYRLMTANLVVINAGSQLPNAIVVKDITTDEHGFLVVDIPVPGYYDPTGGFGVFLTESTSQPVAIVSPTAGHYNWWLDTAGNGPEWATTNAATTVVIPPHGTGG